MKLIGYKLIIFCSLIIGITSCTTATISDSPIASEVTQDTYSISNKTKGTVVLAINWGRHWGCGQYENAEIMDLGFDKLPISKTTDNETPQLYFDGPTRLLKKPTFINYAVSVEPGEYALTKFKIKVAKSVNDVGFFDAKKSHLIEDGKIKSGTFTVDAGESIYIGHFNLGCEGEPIIWRLYTEDRDGYNAFINTVKQKYPSIKNEDVIFRLFKTTTMGLEFELPK